MKMKLGMLKGMEKYQKGVKKVGKVAMFGSKVMTQMMGVNSFTKEEQEMMRNMGKKAVKMIKGRK